MIEALIGYVVGTACCIVVVGIMLNTLQGKKTGENRAAEHLDRDLGIVLGHYCRDCKHRHNKTNAPCDMLFVSDCKHFEWKEDGNA